MKHAGSIAIHLVYQEWDEVSISYNSMPAYDPTPVATLAVNDEDVGKTLAIDLTNLVRQWADENHTPTIPPNLADLSASPEPADVPWASAARTPRHYRDAAP